jgi:hypothetical protein
VHQFKSRGEDGGDEGTAQIASAVIVEYVRSMDVDTELFGLSVSASPAAMNEIDRATLERLNVVNNGRTRPVWTIESADGRLYLKGQRMTNESGINKFILYCMNQRATLLVIFDALHRDNELMNMPAHSLLIDDKVYPINASSKEIRNGLFNGAYNLSPREILALRKAQRVGLALRFTYEAPVFLGFQDMPVAEGREKLVGILNQCK